MAGLAAEAAGRQSFIMKWQVNKGRRGAHDSPRVGCITMANHMKRPPEYSAWAPAQAAPSYSRDHKQTPWWTPLLTEIEQAHSGHYKWTAIKRHQRMSGDKSRVKVPWRDA